MTGTGNQRVWRVMGIYPNSEQIGLVIFEGPGSATGALIKSFPGARKSERAIRSSRRYLGLYQPNVLVLEDCRGDGSSRSPRIERLVDSIAMLAAWEGIDVVRFSRREIRNAFSPYAAWSRYSIAELIARECPELRRRLPPPPKPGEYDRYGMVIFDAASLALTYYANAAGQAASTTK